MAETPPISFAAPLGRIWQEYAAGNFGVSAGGVPYYSFELIPAAEATVVRFVVGEGHTARPYLVYRSLLATKAPRREGERRALAPSVPAAKVARSVGDGKVLADPQPVRGGPRVAGSSTAFQGSRVAVRRRRGSMPPLQARAGRPRRRRKPRGVVGCGRALGIVSGGPLHRPLVSAEVGQ